ncbi:MAG TPA: hypothetical protein VKT80_10970 [Chloroflexota bacterium]|nr:hypothetical protein [Chloroflexota bacterium]
MPAVEPLTAAPVTTGWSNPGRSIRTADNVIDEIVRVVRPLLERLLAERSPATLVGRRRLAALGKMLEEVLHELPSPP